MPTKLGFAAIIVMVLICFVPVTLLWILAVVMLVTSYIDSFAGDLFSFMLLIPTFILLFMGGVGLVGVVLMVGHIYECGYQPANKNTMRCLYTGMLSLVILNIFMVLSLGFSFTMIVFVIPVICSLVLIKLTLNKRPTENISMFNDQII